LRSVSFAVAIAVRGASRPNIGPPPPRRHSGGPDRIGMVGGGFSTWEERLPRNSTRFCHTCGFRCPYSFACDADGRTAAGRGGRPGERPRSERAPGQFSRKIIARDPRAALRCPRPRWDPGRGIRCAASLSDWPAASHTMPRPAQLSKSVPYIA
jgi:hypothetical protein